MGLFHCPMGAPYYDDDVCIDCGMCIATTPEARVEASKKIRAYLKSNAIKQEAVSKIVITGKGGVGKSSITALLANVLMKRGYGVLVLDTDESNPGLFRSFGFGEAPKPLMSLLRRFSSGDEESDSGWLMKERIELQDIPPEFLLTRDALRFLMCGKIDDPFQGCACSIADLAKQFVSRLTINDGTVLIIDTEAGAESFGRGMERSVDTALIVVEPSFESLALAEKLAYMAEGMGIRRIRAILNKVPSEKIRDKMLEELDKRNVQTIGVIYYDPQVNEAGFEGRPCGESKAVSDMEMIVDLLMI